MGSSSRCRALAGYEKVLSFGCPPCVPCGRSSSDVNIATLLQVTQRPCCRLRSSDGQRSSDDVGQERLAGTFAAASRLYDPIKNEQRQRYFQGAVRDFNVQSKSVRHDFELNVPVHVRIRPSDDPVVGFGASIEGRHFAGQQDSCVRPPPNRSPFAGPQSI